MNGIGPQRPNKVLPDRFGNSHSSNIGWLCIPASGWQRQDVNIVGAYQWLEYLPQWGDGLGKAITQQNAQAVGARLTSHGSGQRQGVAAYTALTATCCLASLQINQ
jgi:hypothetical protein